MPNYKMVNADQLDSDLTAIADCLREATGSYDPISFPDGFISKIVDIAFGGGGEAEPDDPFNWPVAVGFDYIECGYYYPTSDETGEVCVPYEPYAVDDTGTQMEFGEPNLVVTVGQGYNFGSENGEISIYACAGRLTGDDPYHAVTAYSGNGYIDATANSLFSQYGDGGLRIKDSYGKMFAGKCYFWLAAHVRDWGLW